MQCIYLKIPCNSQMAARGAKQTEGCCHGIFAVHTCRFLALLDCVSRVFAVARASVVRPSVERVFSETHQANESQFLWKGSYPPYLQTFFSVLKIFWIFEF